MLGIKGRGEGEERRSRGKNLVSCVPLRGREKKAASERVGAEKQRAALGSLWVHGDIGARVPGRRGLQVMGCVWTPKHLCKAEPHIGLLGCNTGSVCAG